MPETSPADGRRGLERLFPDLTARQFLDTCWPDRRHLASHGEPERLAGLCESPALQSIETVLAAHRGETRVVFTDQDGKYRQSHVQPEQAKTLYHGGMSVCLTHVHKSIALVNRWVCRLEKDLGLPPGFGQCNAYVLPPGRGFTKHFDNREVLILQLQGSKRWWVQPNREVANPTQNYILGAAVPPSMREYFPGIEDADIEAAAEVVDLRPGSALFMPRGTWHATDAADHSLSLTFGFFPPTPLEALLDGLGHRLVTEEAWRRPFGAVWGDAGDLKAAAERLGGLLEELGRDLQQWSPEELILNFKSWPAVQAMARRRYQRLGGVDLRVESTPEGPRACIEGDDEVVQVQVEDEMVPMLRWLAERRGEFTQAELHHAVPQVPGELMEGLLSLLEQAGAVAQRS